MRPFSGHPARVRTPSPPGCGVGEIIPLLRALQVSTVLDTWYIYSTDIGEVVRAYSGQFPTIFDPSILGGQNRKNRNYARPRRAVASPFWVHIITCNRKGVASIPHRFVRDLCVSGCGHVSPPFRSPLLVLWFYLFDMLLTCLLDCLGSIEPRVMLQSLLSGALITYLCWLVRRTPRPPQSLLPCASRLVFPRNTLYPPIPRVLVLLLWVFHLRCTFFTKSLHLTHTFPLWFISLFPPVPGLNTSIVFALITVCKAVEGSVRYFNFYVWSTLQKHAIGIHCVHVILVFPFGRGLLQFMF